MPDIWQFSTDRDYICKVIEEQTLLGQTMCRVWLPDRDAVMRVSRSALRSLGVGLYPNFAVGRTENAAAAAKVSKVRKGSTNATVSHVFLTPTGPFVDQFQQQINALSQATSGDRECCSLANEVGLGEPIEAGLIMRELILILCALVQRILFVSPKGIATQWVAEMQTNFEEQYQLVLGDDIAALQRLTPQFGMNANYRNSAWLMFDQVTVFLVSVKPREKRHDWIVEHVVKFSGNWFENLLAAGWNLVVAGESHRLGGSTDQVMRYKQEKAPVEARPYLLLPSMTPHQEKTETFHRLTRLLDEDTFRDIGSVSRDRVAPYVIYTEKRKAIDVDGKPFLRLQRKRMTPVSWESRHYLLHALCEAVTDYLLERYNQTLREKKRHVSFLLILMQRLMVSSTRTINTTPGRHPVVLKVGEQQVSLRLAVLENGVEGSDRPDDDKIELCDIGGQELLNKLLNSHVPSLQNEASRVKALLEATVRCERGRPDANAAALIEWINELQVEKNEPDLRVLIFTKFVPTQKMLKEFLEARGISVVSLKGSMHMKDRQQAQDTFRKSHRVLVSTDAGGEGLNLRFAHVIANYDIPWNPMRLEQRIGRADHIGHPRTVRASNFVIEDLVEFRNCDALKQKLSAIFDEFGFDKSGDVLDTAQIGELFEDVYALANLDPDGTETFVDHTAVRLCEKIQQMREGFAIFGNFEELDWQDAESLRFHPLPHWVEQMAVACLNSHGAATNRNRSSRNMNWPDGQECRKAVFSAQEADRLPDATLLSIEVSRVRVLLLNLPQIAIGLPLHCEAVSGLQDTITGFWGLFEIRLQARMYQKTRHLRVSTERQGYIGLFLGKEGKLFLPTARHTWKVLPPAEATVQTTLGHEESITAHERLQIAAEQEFLDALREADFVSLIHEEERRVAFFASRRMAIERVGLQEVQQFRLSRCDADESQPWKELQAVRQIVPELRP